MQLEAGLDQEKENLKEEVSSLKEAIARIVRSVEFTQYRSDWIDALKAGKDLIDPNHNSLPLEIKHVNINPVIWDAISEGRCNYVILIGHDTYRTGDIIKLRKGYGNTPGYPVDLNDKPYDITCRLGLAMPESDRGMNTGFSVFMVLTIDQ